jgi:hypothetical protein
MAKLSPVPVWQIFDDNGVTIPGALLYTYAAGTTEPKDTYTDHTEATPNPNPIVADAAGRMCIWLGAGNYKMILTDGIGAEEFDPSEIEGTTIWEKDHIAGAGGSGLFYVVENIAALRALTDYEDGATCLILGHTTRNDGGQGLFYFQSNSTSTDDNGTIARPSSNPALGRWIRFINGIIDARWFGAAQGSNDDIAFQSTLIAAAYNRADVLLSKGTYRLTSSIEITGGLRIYGEKATVSMTITTTSYPIFTADSVSGIIIENIAFNTAKICEFISCSNIKIKNCTCDGKPSGKSSIGLKTINIVGCSNVEISGNNFVNADSHIFITSSDGLGTGVVSDNINIYGNMIGNNYHSHASNYPKGISIEYANGVKIHDNDIYDIIPGDAGTYPDKTGYGVFEGLGSCNSLQIFNNRINNSTNTETWNAIFWSMAVQTIIEGNSIEYSGTKTAITPLAINSNISSDNSSSVIKSNICKGCSLWVRVTSLISDILCGSNHIDDTYGHGILIYSMTSNNTIAPIIENNIISNCKRAGIAISGVFDSIVTGNQITDINTSNSSDYDKRSGIVFDSSFLSTVKNNSIRNVSGGRAKYGIDFVVSDYRTRWIASDNVFTGMETGEYNAGYTSFPAGYIWNVGDEACNTASNDSVSSRWKCIGKDTSITVAEATTGDDHIVVDLSDDIDPGDLVGIQLISNVIQWVTVLYTIPNVEADTTEIYFNSTLTSDVNDEAAIFIMKWRSVDPQSIDIYIKGTNASGFYREISINGRRILYGTVNPGGNRGLALSVFDIDTMAIVSQENYDIYVGSSQATALSVALSYLTRAQIGIITSQGSFNKNINSDLQTAAKRVGLYKLASIPTGTNNYYAYSAIFIGAGAGAPNTELNKSVIEIVQDENNDCPSAVINTTYYKGGFAGSSLTNSLLSGNPSAINPIAYGDSIGALRITGRMIENQGSDVASAENISLGLDGNTFEITGSGTIKLMAKTGWSEGSMVTLINSGGAEFSHNEDSSSDFIPFFNKSLTGVSTIGAHNYTLATTSLGLCWYEC